MISVDEISRMTEKKNKLKKETYVKLYEQASRKIRRAVDFGGKYTIYIVPSILLGYPMYDRMKATAYLKRQLIRGGFEVVVVDDYVLHITWKIKKVATKDDKPNEDDFPTLINLKKAANKYRNAEKK